MFYLLLLGHWVSDFIMQTDEMAQNKSKSLKWLAIHVSTYTLVLSAFALPILFIESFDKWTAFVLTNGVSHGIIDLTTPSVFYEIDIPLIFQCQKSSFTILSKGLHSVGVF